MAFENKYGIPRHDAEISLPGRITASVRREHDDTLGEPWKEHDGHVTGIRAVRTAREKSPNERTLYDGTGRYATVGDHILYDFAESVRIAKRDGWDTEPYGQGTKGERAVRAVLADAEILRQWCANDWHWCGVIVTLTDADGREISSDSIWGIESYGDYWKEIATEMIDRLHAHAMKEKREAWREALTNARFAKSELIEVAYWNSRDVRTAHA